MRAAVLTLLKGRTHVKFAVDVAETDAEKRQGLSHRARVQKGLVFPHYGETRAVYSFRDMLVPIDVVAIDVDGLVRFTVQTVAPRTPDVVIEGFPLGLVVELPAGTVARQGIDNRVRVVRLGQEVG